MVEPNPNLRVITNARKKSDLELSQEKMPR